VHLSEAQADHQMLLNLVKTQLLEGDPASVEAFALVAVRDLLQEHQPDLDESRSSGLTCVPCWDTWPCGVFQAIEKASHHGE
jgi:hypothetical protein